MGKVSLLDVTASQGPGADPNANTAKGGTPGQPGQFTGDQTTMGGKLAILTNPDQVISFFLLVETNEV
jgi:hypothetical protein